MTRPCISRRDEGDVDVIELASIKFASRGAYPDYTAELWLWLGEEMPSVAETDNCKGAGWEKVASFSQGAVSARTPLVMQIADAVVPPIGPGDTVWLYLHSPTGGNAVAFTDPRPATVKDDALQLKPGFYTKEERIFRGACEGVYLPAGAVEYRLSTALGSASNALDPVGVCREQLKLAGKRRAIVSDECGAVVHAARSDHDRSLGVLQAAEASMASRLAAEDCRVEEFRKTLVEKEEELAGFRRRVSEQGLGGLTAGQVLTLLKMVGVKGGTIETLEAQGISGDTLPVVTEPEMVPLMGLDRLGDRRRLSLALQALADRRGFQPPSASLSGPEGWNAEVVGSWLNKHGLDQFVGAFSAQDLDGRCLISLSANDLKALGVTVLGQRSAFMAALGVIKADAKKAATAKAAAHAAAIAEAEAASAAAAMAPEGAVSKLGDP